MIAGQLVFVPLFGEEHIEDWKAVPHVKVWGLAKDDDGGDEFRSAVIVLHWEIVADVVDAGNIVHNMEQFKPLSVFNSEMRFLERLDGTEELPEQVSVALATLALAPQTLVRED